MVMISVDAGNGVTNATDGKQSIYFASVRASATGDSLGLGKQFEMDYEYVDWGGHRYVFGDDALKVSRRAIERHQGAFRYGDEFHQFLVAVAVSQMGVCNGKVDLVLFAPPGMYSQVVGEIEKRFMEKSGNVALKFKSDKNPRKFKYSSITVWPEGIGAAACFMINARGKQRKNLDIFSGETIILDSGMHTLDALQMSNGSFNPESLATATWENGGIKTHILEPILRTVKKMGEDYDLLTNDDIDIVLRSGVQEDDWGLKIAGGNVNLKPAFDKYSQRYAEWIGNNVIDGAFNGLRGIKSAILVGGGASLIEPFMSRWYNEKILRFDSQKETKGINPIYANAVGGYRLTKMAQKTK
jgi:actin-like protein